MELERLHDIVKKKRAGKKQKDIARLYRISEGRVSQLLSLYRERIGEV